MQVPVLPGPRGWRRQRHPAPAAPPPLSVSAPKKRNSSATITPRASSSGAPNRNRSEEHTSELQSQSNLVCRLLLEKKKTRAMQLVIERSHEPIHRQANRV